MTDSSFLHIPPELSWPFALALAWICAEAAYRLLRLPRISSYGIVGFLLAQHQTGFLSNSDHTAALFANIAFGLILFELGYRINLRWLRTNPWLGVTSIVETSATFIAVYFAAQWFGVAFLPSLLLASLAMATSPVAVLRVVNEQHSSGQVTERTLHLSAFNCVLAVFIFKLVIGLWVFQNTGDVLLAFWNGLLVLITSVAIGGLFGAFMPALLQRFNHQGSDTTLAFAIAVIVLVALTDWLGFSPVPAALTCGLMARHRRGLNSRVYPNFGALGNLLIVLLFVFMASSLQWTTVQSGLGLALALIAVRCAVKMLSVAAFAHVSGITWRKGLLTGMALAPTSAFVILMLEQNRGLGIELMDQLAALAAATLLMEVLGPIVTQWALRLAGETPRREH